MRRNRWLLAWALLMAGALSLAAGAAIREENFDREPVDWEGVNNRNFDDIQYTCAPDPLLSSSIIQ